MGGPLGFAGDDAHMAAPGEPVEGGARRVEPAVAVIQDRQQAMGKFVAQTAGADLPDIGTPDPAPQLHVIDEGIVNVAGQDDEVPRGLGMAEDIEDGVGGARVGHPVLGIHHQGVS